VQPESFTSDHTQGYESSVSIHEEAASSTGFNSRVIAYFRIIRDRS